MPCPLVRRAAVGLVSVAHVALDVEQIAEPVEGGTTIAISRHVQGPTGAPVVDQLTRHIETARGQGSGEEGIGVLIHGVASETAAIDGSVKPCHTPVPGLGNTHAPVPENGLSA